MKTSALAFCDQSVEQIVDHSTKKSILDTVRMCTTRPLIPKKCILLKNLKDFDTLIEKPHLVSLIHTGIPYWLLLTEYNGIRQCVLIERRIKPGYPFSKMLLPDFNFSPEVFENTLFQCEVIIDITDTESGKYVILIDDLIAYRGKNMITQLTSYSTRYAKLQSIFNEHYTEDIMRQPCSLQIKKMFEINQLKQLINFSKSLPYSIKGIRFTNVNETTEHFIWFVDLKQISIKQLNTHEELKWLHEWLRTQNERLEWIFEIEIITRTMYILVDGILQQFGLIDNIIYDEQLILSEPNLISKPPRIRVLCAYNVTTTKWNIICETQSPITELHRKDIYNNGRKGNGNGKGKGKGKGKGNGKGKGKGGNRGKGRKGDGKGSIKGGKGGGKENI